MCFGARAGWQWPCRVRSTYVHRDRTDYWGWGACDVHIDFHTAPRLLLFFFFFLVLVRCTAVDQQLGQLAAKAVQLS